MSIYENKISEDDEEKITGGVDNAAPERGGRFPFPKPAVVSELPWEVVDDADGRTLGRYATKEEAEKMAGVKQQSSSEISMDVLSKLRQTRPPHGIFKFGFGHKFHK